MAAAPSPGLCLMPNPAMTRRRRDESLQIISILSLSRSDSLPGTFFPAARDPPLQHSSILNIYHRPSPISRTSRTSTRAPPKLLVLGNEVDSSKYSSAEKVHRKMTETRNISTQVMNAGVPTTKSNSDTYCVRLNHWY